MRNIFKDILGRLIIVDLCINEQEITIAALYAPNEDSPQFFQELGRYLKERNEKKILVGDFNLVLDVELDRENTYCNNNRAKYQVEQLMDEFSLNDTWRNRNPDIREFSWRKAHHYPTKASRIDFALISGGLDQRVEMIMYFSSVFTDHRAIYIYIELDPFERGKGYWKLNTSFLQKRDYIDLINSVITSTLSLREESPSIQWEALKVKVKEASVKYAKLQKSEQIIVLSQLSEAVNGYEERLPLNLEENKLYENTKAEYEEKIIEKVQGIMFRSKAKWYEQGERNTKYFFSLEKARYNAKTCYKLIDDKGDEIVTPEGILEEERKFYEKLYEKDHGVHFNLPNIYGVHVPQEERQKQQEQITLEQLGIALKTMNNNKTPGQDGLPADFYKVFWSKLKFCFYDMMQECYQRGKLHDTAREGILNLIPKANRDTRYIKNLRPITLLNTDYKIIEKAIANKILPSLAHIIHKDQRGFMKERRISVNIRKMLDIMHELLRKKTWKQLYYPWTLSSALINAALTFSMAA